MDFTLTEEHKRLQATVRELASKKFAPVADRLDQKEEFAWDNFRAMAEMGLTGMGIPLEYGGSGGDKLSLALAMEEIARACASTAGILGAHLVLCTEPIYLYGNEQQRRRFLPILTRGEKIGAFAITEAEAGSDVSAIKSTATRDGDSYILNGSKVFITNGDVCDVALIFANVPELGKRGMTAFILEAGMPGFRKGKKYNKLGMRALTNSELIFENCRVPAANRLGEEGQGMKLCLATLDRGRISIAAQAVGITQAVLDKATEYAKQRIQFGAPIGDRKSVV